MNVGDKVKVKVYHGRYDCYESQLTGVIESVSPNPPIDIEALNFYHRMKEQYPDFWVRNHLIYWIHITDNRLSEYQNKTIYTYDFELEKE